MPLTDKGKKILKAMRKQYGPDKGEEVFYASINKGTIKGVEKNDDKQASLVGTLADMVRKTAVSQSEATPEQLEAGNYKKQHRRIHGLDITIENVKGSTRSGISRSGKSWQSKMYADYGYIRRTEARDGDHVDVFIGPDKDSELVVVINQVRPGSGRFDEHKVILGCSSEEQARRLYLKNYEKGWKGLGDSVTLTVAQFKDWLDNGDTLKRLQPVKAAAVSHALRRVLSSKEFTCKKHVDR